MDDIFDSDKKVMNINMTGKEYVEYHRYRDSKRKISPGIRAFMKASAPFFIIALLVALGGIVAFAIYYDPAPIAAARIDVFGVSISEPIILFLAVSAGIAWMLHGFGFIVVRR